MKKGKTTLTFAELRVLIAIYMAWYHNGMEPVNLTWRKIKALTGGGKWSILRCAKSLQAKGLVRRVRSGPGLTGTWYNPTFL